MYSANVYYIIVFYDIRPLALAIVSQYRNYSVLIFFFFSILIYYLLCFHVIYFH